MNDVPPVGDNQIYIGFQGGWAGKMQDVPPEFDRIFWENLEDLLA
jgi:hypothetical protein